MPGARFKPDSSANLGFEGKLWLAADKLRGNDDAAEPVFEAQFAESAKLESAIHRNLASFDFKP